MALQKLINGKNITVIGTGHSLDLLTPEKSNETIIFPNSGLAYGGLKNYKNRIWIVGRTLSKTPFMSFIRLLEKVNVKPTVIICAMVEDATITEKNKLSFKYINKMKTCVEEKFPEIQFFTITKDINGIISTGMMCLEHGLKHNPKKIMIAGLDSVGRKHKYGYSKECAYQKVPKVMHYDANVRYLKSLNSENKKKLHPILGCSVQKFLDGLK